MSAEQRIQVVNTRTGETGYIGGTTPTEATFNQGQTYVTDENGNNGRTWGPGEVEIVYVPPYVQAELANVAENEAITEGYIAANYTNVGTGTWVSTSTPSPTPELTLVSEGNLISKMVEQDVGTQEIDLFKTPSLVIQTDDGGSTKDIAAIAIATDSLLFRTTTPSGEISYSLVPRNTSLLPTLEFESGEEPSSGEGEFLNIGGGSTINLPVFAEFYGYDVKRSPIEAGADYGPGTGTIIGESITLIPKESAIPMGLPEIPKPSSNVPSDEFLTSTVRPGRIRSAEDLFQAEGAADLFVPLSDEEANKIINIFSDKASENRYNLQFYGEANPSKSLLTPIGVKQILPYENPDEFVSFREMQLFQTKAGQAQYTKTGNPIIDEFAGFGAGVSDTVRAQFGLGGASILGGILEAGNAPVLRVGGKTIGVLPFIPSFGVSPGFVTLGPVQAGYTQGNPTQLIAIAERGPSYVVGGLAAEIGLAYAGGKIIEGGAKGIGLLGQKAGLVPRIIETDYLGTTTITKDAGRKVSTTRYPGGEEESIYGSRGLEPNEFFKDTSPFQKFPGLSEKFPGLSETRDNPFDVFRKPSSESISSQGEIIPRGYTEVKSSSQSLLVKQKTEVITQKSLLEGNYQKVLLEEKPLVTTKETTMFPVVVSTSLSQSGRQIDEQRQLQALVPQIPIEMNITNSPIAQSLIPPQVKAKRMLLEDEMQMQITSTKTPEALKDYTRLVQAPINITEFKTEPSQTTIERPISLEKIFPVQTTKASQVTQPISSLFPITTTKAGEITKTIPITTTKVIPITKQIPIQTPVRITETIPIQKNVQAPILKTLTTTKTTPIFKIPIPEVFKTTPSLKTTPPFTPASSPKVPPLFPFPKGEGGGVGRMFSGKQYGQKEILNPIRDPLFASKKQRNALKRLFQF